MVLLILDGAFLH